MGGQRASFRVEAVNPAFVRLSVQGPGGPVCQPSREAESISCVWRPPSDTDVVVEADGVTDPTTAKVLEASKDGQLLLRVQRGSSAFYAALKK